MASKVLIHFTLFFFLFDQGADYSRSWRVAHRIAGSFSSDQDSSCDPQFQVSTDGRVHFFPRYSGCGLLRCVFFTCLVISVQPMLTRHFSSSTHSSLS